MKEACLTLDFPVVSGNVSLYNETNGQAILPTPTIGAIGLLKQSSKAVGMGFVNDGDSIVVIGDAPENVRGHMGQSTYLREIEGREDGTPPPVDLNLEKRHGDFVRNQILGGVINACHDVSDGGLLVSVAEMALSGDKGCEISQPDNRLAPHIWAFGEDQARYIVTTKNVDHLISQAQAQAIPATVLGKVGGSDLSLASNGHVSLQDLRTSHESWMPDYMAD